MAAHIVWIDGNRFRKVTLTPTYKDARIVREYWERRGMRVTIARVKVDDIETAQVGLF